MNDQRLRETTCTKLQKKFDEQFKKELESIYEDVDTIDESYAYRLEKKFRENKDNIELIEKAEDIGVDFNIKILHHSSNCSGRKYPKVHLRCNYRIIK